jgi:hypothetical protein
MTEQITNFIKEDIPFIFVKFGDGEFNAAVGNYGCNCDNDPYTLKLKNGIINAIEYYSRLNNAYCGEWHTSNVSRFFNSIALGKLNWVNYHTCIMDDNSFNNEDKLNLFKSIHNSKRKKLLIANELMVRAKYLLNINHHVVVPYQNWLDHDFDTIFNEIINFLKNDQNPLIITCAGMASKVLIMELHKLFPNGIFIDIGSGLDYLCTKKCSRGNAFAYEKLEEYFKEILPENWNDNSFNWIYEKAKSKIGLHLS